MKPSFWTPEWDNVLIGLLADKTLSGTAEELSKLAGKQFTRSAIAGRTLRLTREGVTIKRQEHTIGGKPRGTKSPRVRMRGPRPVIVPPTQPEPLNLDIFTVGRNQCRFPVSGEGYQTMFCGHGTPDGVSYCGWHCSLVYEAPKARAAIKSFAPPEKFKPRFRAA